MWIIPEVTPHVCHHTYYSNMAKTYVDELLECFQWSDDYLACL